MRIAVLAAALAAWPMLALAQDASTTTTAAPAVTTTTPAPKPAPTASTTTSAAPEKPQASDDATTTLTADQQRELQREQTFYNSLHRQTGVISISGGRVSINVPETY